MNDFPPAYDPGATEEKWYKFWQDNGLFTPDPRSGKPTYTIMIPLPNVTGRLTLGHTLNNSIQDILIRYKKLNGFETLWMMGMDHAGIATQVVVEDKLRSEGTNKADLGREKFVAEVWKWKEQYAEVIRKQIRKMGFAVDWTREQFTLDERYSQQVIRVFAALYDKGLLYRGEYIINWCPRCGSALSDEQVETEEIPGKLYYIRYPVKDSNDLVTVATTRPETMIGDTAVCVNPGDNRYTHLKGKTIILPIMKREIPVIFDEYVDPEFGTGALKITPAHDAYDFILARKHGLELINIMNNDATMNENAGQYQGLNRDQVREKVLKELEEQGLLERTEKYRLPLAKCERCSTPIEPRISKQWFVRMKPLAEPALKAVAEGRIKLHPKRWVNLYNHWLENVRDWCISRQLWWGHRIPVYYCPICHDGSSETDQGMIVSERRPDSCPVCGNKQMRQDEDVLDTWFSSWLWPFVTLGWPDETEDYARFYPTQTLVTGWDIIYLWVARMIMAGIEFTGKIPFSDVVFHPMIRDEKGRKMSKSLGNSPEPIDLIEKFGADALRFGIQLITPREQDVLFSEKTVDVGRRFCNKLWNAARLIAINHADQEAGIPEKLTPYDAWILKETDQTIERVNDYYRGFELNNIARELYGYVWHQFCDWYLEFTKLAPTVQVPRFLLKQIIIMLHPFLPFITEDLYQRFSFGKKSIMLESWPGRIAVKDDTGSVIKYKELIEEIRVVRGIFRFAPKEELSVVIKTSDRFRIFIAGNLPVIKKLAGVGSVEFDRPVDGPCATIVLSEVECFVMLTGLDPNKEKQRLLNELSFLSGRIDEIRNRLVNPGYLEKASEVTKSGEQKRFDDFIDKKAKIERMMKRL